MPQYIIIILIITADLFTPYMHKCSLGSLNSAYISASVETGLIYRSPIQILILTQRVKITHKKLCTNLIKQQIQLFCCSVSVVCSFFLSYKFRQDNQFV